MTRTRTRQLSRTQTAFRLQYPNAVIVVVSTRRVEVNADTFRVDPSLSCRDNSCFVSDNTKHIVNVSRSH